jgi:hypothetical protein
MQPQRRLGVSCAGVWENTMVSRRSVLPAYPALERGSDTVVRQWMQGHSTIALLDQPDLYAYCYTGENTWDADHFLRFLIKGGQEYCAESFVQAMAKECFRCVNDDGLL